MGLRRGRIWGQFAMGRCGMCIFAEIDQLQILDSVRVGQIVESAAQTQRPRDRTNFVEGGGSW